MARTQRLLFGLFALVALGAGAALWWRSAPVERDDPPFRVTVPRAMVGEVTKTAKGSSAPPPTPTSSGLYGQLFRLTPGHRAQSPVGGPSVPHLKWVYRTEGRVTAQPVHTPSGRIVFGSHDHFLYALSPLGQLLWKVDLGDRIYASAFVDDDGNIYVGSDDDRFWSLNEDGQVRWSILTGGDADTAPNMGPDGTLYFASGNALYAVQPRSGTVRWRFEARNKIYTSPAIAPDGTIYVGSQDDRLYALGPEGRVRWSFRTRGDIDSSPAFDETTRSVFFGSDDQHVYRLSHQGALEWKTPVGGYVRAPVALYGSERVIVGVHGPRPRVLGLASETGELAWSYPLSLSESAEIGVSSGPVVDASGRIYVGGHDDRLRCLNPDGKERWEFPVEGDVDTAVLIGLDGTAYFASDDQHLYALSGRLLEPQ